MSRRTKQPPKRPNRLLRRAVLFAASAAVIAAVVVAVALLRGGDDEQKGAGFDPVTLERIEPTFSKEAQRIYVRTWYSPKEETEPLVICEATGPDGKARRMARLAVGLVEPGVAQVGIPITPDDPDGPYAIACVSSPPSSGRQSFFTLEQRPDLPQVKAAFELKNDPDWVVVKKIAGKFLIPTYRFDPNGPPVQEQTIEREAEFTIYKSGRVQQKLGEVSILYQRVEGAAEEVYRSPEQKASDQLTQVFELTFVPEGVVVHTIARNVNGRVDETKALWVLAKPAG